MTEVKLMYYIQDQPHVSHVTISPNETIAHLKQKIHNQCRNTFMRLGYDARELILRKVRYIMISVNIHVIKRISGL
jgi:hypothetical protein